MDIHNFTDYRSFLLAYADDAKKANPHWTYGIWAKRLGLKDTSSITKIVRGQRHPGPELTDQLIKNLGFDVKRAQYFRDLIHLQKVKKDPRLSLLLLEKMSKNHPQAVSRILDDETFSLISNWYCTAIREMVRLDHFFEDPKWVSRQLHFKVTPTQASRALDLLFKVDLLKRDRNGKLQITDKRFATQNDYASEAIKRYHEAMLDNAKLAIRKIPVERRDFQASVLTMNFDSISEAKELIRQFKDSFCRLLEKEKGDGTFQIQIQFFPLTKESVEGDRQNKRGRKGRWSVSSGGELSS
ncbi:MAG: TIGR02147 family protein [Deltaproteobacteria bacterium]|nr:TIGR02147 family protein [Deltaproteobacteria bacterium]